MTFVYLRSEPQLWTVGFYKPDGKWEPDSDHGSADEAAERVRYLNGGVAEKPHPEVDERGKPYVRIVAGDFDTKWFIGERQVAAVWGPAADGSGEWFGRSVDDDGERFPSRADAFRTLLDRVTALSANGGTR